MAAFEVVILTLAGLVGVMWAEPVARPEVTFDLHLASEVICQKLAPTCKTSLTVVLDKQLAVRDLRLGDFAKNTVTIRIIDFDQVAEYLKTSALDSGVLASFDLVGLPLPTYHRSQPCEYFFVGRSTVDDYLDATKLTESQYYSPLRSYFVVVEDGAADPEAFSKRLLNFGRWHRELKYVAGIGNSDGNTGIELFVPNTLRDGILDKASLTTSVFSNWNYEGTVTKALVCPICEPAYEEYLKTGLWADYIMGFIYETTQKVNSTMTLSAVYSLPKTGLNEDGEWDEYLKPIVEDEAVFAAIMRESNVGHQVAYFSHPGHYDTISFVTTPFPRVADLDSFLLLIKPLSATVWVLMLLTQVALVAVILAVDWIDAGRFEFRYLRQAVMPLWQPALDQPCFKLKESPAFLRDFIKKLMVGAWLISLISLMCGYKSKFTVMVMLPHEEQIPRTFEDLALSNYNIGAIFYKDNIEEELLSSTNPVIQNVSRRTVEFNYFDYECYHRILTSDAVCIGYTEMFDSIGSQFMMDVRKRKLYVHSAEVIFANFASIAINKNHPVVQDVINGIIRWLDSTGVTNFWHKYAIADSNLKGKESAFDFPEDPFYNGTVGNARFGQRNQFNRRRFAFLIGELLAAGFLIASVVFTSEVVVGSCLRHFCKNPKLEDMTMTEKELEIQKIQAWYKKAGVAPLYYMP